MNAPFVIFDRDGTLIDSVHHLVDPNKVKLKSGLLDCMVELKSVGFRFGMITNQSVISRGMASMQDVEKVNRKITDALEPFGITFDFIFICPHLPTHGCSCRKPNIDFGVRAVREYGLLPELSYMVGDQVSDLEFAKNMGLIAIQLRSESKKSDLADYFACTLLDVANWVIHNKNSRTI